MIEAGAGRETLCRGCRAVRTGGRGVHKVADPLTGNRPVPHAQKKSPFLKKIKWLEFKDRPLARMDARFQPLLNRFDLLICC